MTKPDLDFRTKEEFEQVCKYLGARMHHLNRTVMGESGFVHAVADQMKNAGQVFDAHYENKETRAAFGDGYTAGTISRKDRAVALHALMYPPK